jgi:succinate dehydrogenase / fumarate reductase iron-sulfur subunit
MVAAMERERFGNCSNFGECEAVCPKGIGLAVIARLNRDLVRANLRSARSSEAAAPA